MENNNSDSRVRFQIPQQDFLEACRITGERDQTRVFKALMAMSRREVPSTGNGNGSYEAKPWLQHTIERTRLHDEILEARARKLKAEAADKTLELALKVEKNEDIQRIVKAAKKGWFCFEHFIWEPADESCRAREALPS